VWLSATQGRKFTALDQLDVALFVAARMPLSSFDAIRRDDHPCAHRLADRGRAEREAR